MSEDIIIHGSDVEKIYDESLNFLGELDDYFKKVKGNVNGKKK